MALVIAGGPIARIGEPDRIVGFYNRAVRRIELFALVIVGQHGNLAAVLGTGDAARRVFAADQPPLPIARVAVGEVGRRAEHRRVAGQRVVAHQPVVRDVAEDYAVHVAEPHRTLGPFGPGPDAAQQGRAGDVFLEPRIERLDVRIGIGDGRIPVAPVARRQRWAGRDRVGGESGPGDDDPGHRAGCRLHQATTIEHCFLPQPRFERLARYDSKCRVTEKRDPREIVMARRGEGLIQRRPSPYCCCR